MRVELVEADRKVLDNLAQLYQYDMSAFDGADVDGVGRYTWKDWNRFFANPVRHAFLVLVDGRLAGFATMRLDSTLRDPSEEAWWMDEFFVMRKYRSQGVGERVATDLFDRFPGTWEVAQMATNLPAQAFWRKTIGRYTDGDYQEVDVDDDRWRGPVQYLRSAAR